MNIEELKRLAEAATPGPWFAEASWQSTILEGRHDGKWAIRSSKKSHGFSPLAYVKGDKRITGGDGSLNAQFIAAANPAAVLELIAEVDRLRDEVNGMTGTLARIETERNNQILRNHNLEIELRECRSIISRLAQESQDAVEM